MVIIVSGAVVARPEGFNDLLEASLAHVARSRGEAGCQYHSVQIDAENPLRLVFFEKWDDMAALKAHFRQAGSSAFMAAVGALSARQETMEIFSADLVGR